MRRSLPALTTLVVLLGFASACGGTVSQMRMDDPATLLAERDEWRGARIGAVILRLHVEALVDTRPDPAKAQSALVVHLVAAHYGVSAPIPVAFPVPRGARLASADLRLILTPRSASAATRTTLAAAPTFAPCALEDMPAGCVDPDQDAVALALPAPPEGGLIEAILRFDVPGTLASDARHMGLVDLPVGELLLRYDLATDTVGTFQTTQPNARPVVTDKDGRRLIALLAANLAPVTATSPLARFVTVRASPKGYDQTFAADWTGTTAAYRARVVDASDALGDGYEVPYRPVGSGRAQVLDALAWVRGRPLRASPNVRWDTTHSLPLALAKNDITTVDRTHLLHWVLREAGIAHRFIMARGGARAPLDPAFPVAGVFDAPLIHLTDLGLVLDPACDACDPGQVRASLRGGQALALPLVPGTKTATFIALPLESTP